MKRSSKFIFVPFCLTCQGVRAEGIVRHYPACVEPVVTMLMHHNINIVQMSCPELHFDEFHRKPCGKKKYDIPQNRKVYKQLAEREVERMHIFLKNGCELIGILGIEFSPSCAVSKLTSPPRGQISGQGIFIEEIKIALQQYKLDIPLLGVEIYHIDRTLDRLAGLII